MPATNSPSADPLSPENVAARFPKVEAPGTGRAAYRITEGPDYCQAMYYFIPSMTEDGRWLAYQRHRVEDDAIIETRWESLDLLTGERRPLARVSASPGFAFPNEPPVFNAARRELIYCSGDAYRAVRLDTLEDRLLLQVPADRVAHAQNCASPCGRYFFFISHDARQMVRVKEEGRPRFKEVSDTHLVRFDLDTGEQRLVVRINAFTKHVVPYGSHHLVFSYDHLPTEHMILLTDYQGGWYAALRTPDEPGVHTCHYNATRRGVHYEAGGKGVALGGVVCPRTHRRTEFPAPRIGGRHVAAVPDGRCWMTDGQVEGGRVLYALSELPEDGEPSWQLLSGPWLTCGTGQKSHAHPRVTPCGRWTLLLAGDPATKTNQLFLLDIRDVLASSGLPDYAADAGGEYPA